jgi:hypothetical protein
MRNNTVLPVEVLPQYVCSIQGRVVKTYYDQSQYATIIQTDSGHWYCHKVSTGVFFPAKSYAEAKAFRNQILNRGRAINACFR